MTSPSNRPLVSIIVPCYNQAHVLAEAIDSALAQSYDTREIVVIDDGSTDDTAAVAGRYGRDVHLIRQTNAGLPAARNRGISETRGSIIGLLDADDRWLSDHLESKVGLFADPGVSAVHGSYRKFPDDQPGAGVTRKRHGAEADFHRLLGGNALGAPVSVLFRRSAYQKAGGFDPAFYLGAEDWDLWLRIARTGRIVADAAVTAEYRLSLRSMSRNYNRMYRALRQVVAKNGRYHAACSDCRAAIRRADRHIRAYYRDAATRDAWRALAEGHYARYLFLRARGALRDPHCLARFVPAMVGGHGRAS